MLTDHFKDSQIEKYWWGRLLEVFFVIGIIPIALFGLGVYSSIGILISVAIYVVVVKLLIRAIKFVVFSK